MWRDSGVDEKKLQTVNYRGLCKVMINEVNKLDNNWRTGNFKRSSKSVYSSYGSSGTIGDHCISLSFRDGSWCHGNMFIFFHRTNLEVQSLIVIPDGLFAVTNAEIVVVWDEKNMEVLDINGQLISEVPELDEDERISWNLTSCCL
jgi:hypothetical protein